jgi:hypothetical protein
MGLRRLALQRGREGGASGAHDLRGFRRCRALFDRLPRMGEPVGGNFDSHPNFTPRFHAAFTLARVCSTIRPIFQSPETYALMGSPEINSYNQITSQC